MAGRKIDKRFGTGKGFFQRLVGARPSTYPDLNKREQDLEPVSLIRPEEDSPEAKPVRQTRGDNY